MPTLTVFIDGDNEPVGLSEVLAGFQNEWTRSYRQAGGVVDVHEEHTNVNVPQANLPPALGALAAVRNPDVFLYEATGQVELGAIEITVHSPDGSNIEKRYPL